MHRTVKLTVLVAVAMSAVFFCSTPAQAIDFHRYNEAQLRNLLTNLARLTYIANVWVRADDDSGRFGGSDGSPDGKEKVRFPPRPGFPDDVFVGDDGIIWVCVLDPLGGCEVDGGDGSDELGEPDTPRVPGVWIARPLSEFVAEVQAALPAGPSEDERNLAQWIEWGLDPGLFNPCAFEAERQSRE